MNYKDITNEMETGKVYKTDYLITSIAQEFGISEEEVKTALNSAPETIIYRYTDEDGVDVCKLLRQPMP